jgi:manganese/iron transport system permease protein
VSALWEPFSSDFMQRALVATLIVGVLSPAVGTWVVLRRMANLGDALGHGTLAGVAVAYAAGVSVLWGALVLAVLMALALAALLQHRGLGAESVVSIVGTGLFAVGVIVISRQRTGVELTHFLFGRILTVSTVDIVTNVVLCGAALATLGLVGRDLRLATFDRQHAIQVGVKVTAVDTVLLVLVAVSVVVSLRTVGTVMAVAMVVTPAATAQLVARRTPTMTLIGIAIAELSGVSGLIIAYHLDVSPGATIALVCTGVFVLVYVLRTAPQWVRHARGRPAGSVPMRSR